MFLCCICSAFNPAADSTTDGDFRARCAQSKLFYVLVNTGTKIQSKMKDFQKSFFILLKSGLIYLKKFQQAANLVNFIVRSAPRTRSLFSRLFMQLR